MRSFAVKKELDIDATKLSVNGGAIALGHPLGATKKYDYFVPIYILYYC
ncbi:hypothetical protein [Solibacillus sp. FSL K6-1523]